MPIVNLLFFSSKFTLQYLLHYKGWNPYEHLSFTRRMMLRFLSRGCYKDTAGGRGTVWQRWQKQSRVWVCKQSSAPAKNPEYVSPSHCFISSLALSCIVLDMDTAPSRAPVLIGNSLTMFASLATS